MATNATLTDDMVPAASSVSLPTPPANLIDVSELYDWYRDTGRLSVDEANEMAELTWRARSGQPATIGTTISRVASNSADVLAPAKALIYARKNPDVTASALVELYGVTNSEASAAIRDAKAGASLPEGIAPVVPTGDRLDNELPEGGGRSLVMVAVVAAGIAGAIILYRLARRKG